jgi:hypothetical protein
MAMAAARVTLAEARRDVFIAWREVWGYLVSVGMDSDGRHPEAYALAQSVDRAIKLAFTPK